jgi:hypothetical protein
MKKETIRELLAAVFIASIMMLVGTYIFYSRAKPISEACANTNGTVIVNGREIDCYQMKYNFTVH